MYFAFHKFWNSMFNAPSCARSRLGPRFKIQDRSRSEPPKSFRGGRQRGTEESEQVGRSGREEPGLGKFKEI